MAKIDIQPFNVGAGAASGITIAYANSAAGNYIRLGISKAAQETFFGRALLPGQDRFRIEIDDDPELRTFAQLELIRDAGVKDTHDLHGAGFGSVVLKLLPWVTPQSEKIKSHPVRASKVSSHILQLTLPLWAQPGRPRPAPKKIGEGKSIMDELPIRK